LQECDAREPSEEGPDYNGPWGGGNDYYVRVAAQSTTLETPAKESPEKTYYSSATSSMGGKLRRRVYWGGLQGISFKESVRIKITSSDQDSNRHPN